MKHSSIALALVAGLLLTGVLVLATGARAHEQETSVDWEVAYANLRVLGPPVYTRSTSLPATCTGGTPGVISGVGGAYPTITLLTGDYLCITWSFRYIGGGAVRGDLFWITRLGLDFGTVGRYINGGWIGASSFPMIPNTQYNATLVIRSIQPTFRHLHVGVSVQNVGNIPAAPTTLPIPTGGPVLYGLFTDASGAVVEPLQGVAVPPFGNLQLIAPWPWAVASTIGQILIGFAFIGIMWWYARYESKRGARA